MCIKVSTPSASKCLQLCRNKKGCQWSSHDSIARTCLLFEDCDHLDTTYSNATTSEIDCKDNRGEYSEFIYTLIVVPGIAYDF